MYAPRLELLLCSSKMSLPRVGITLNVAVAVAMTYGKVFDDLTDNTISKHYLVGRHCRVLYLPDNVKGMWRHG